MNLKDRMAEFEGDRMSVALSISAYNRAPDGIRRYLADVTVLNEDEAELRFWELVGNRDEEYLASDETTKYVPKFFAAAIVGENPEAFGLDVEPLSHYAAKMD